jgi:hypothetical protein
MTAYGQQTPPRRNPLLVPLLVLSAFVAVLVVVAGGVLVVVLLGNRPSPILDATAERADCVVGSWTASSTRLRVNQQINGYAVAGEFTSRGVRMRLDGNGTGVTDYGNGVTFTSPGMPEQVFAGTISFDYRADGGRITFANVVSNATVSLNVPYVGRYTERTEPIAGAANYTCAPGSLTLTNPHYTMELHT